MVGSVNEITTRAARKAMEEHKAAAKRYISGMDIHNEFLGAVTENWWRSLLVDDLTDNGRPCNGVYLKHRAVRLFNALSPGKVSYTEVGDPFVDIEGDPVLEDCIELELSHISKQVLERIVARRDDLQLNLEGLDLLLLVDDTPEVKKDEDAPQQLRLF